jgi:hypothetical protein
MRLMVAQKQPPYYLSAHIDKNFDPGNYTKENDPGDYTETLFIMGYHGLNGEEVIII